MRHTSLPASARHATHTLRTSHTYHLSGALPCAKSNLQRPRQKAPKPSRSRPLARSPWVGGCARTGLGTVSRSRSRFARVSTRRHRAHSTANPLPTHGRAGRWPLSRVRARLGVAWPHGRMAASTTATPRRPHGPPHTNHHPTPTTPHPPPPPASTSQHTLGNFNPTLPSTSLLYPQGQNMHTCPLSSSTRSENSRRPRSRCILRGIAELLDHCQFGPSWLWHPATASQSITRFINGTKTSSLHLAAIAPGASSG